MEEFYTKTKDEIAIMKQCGEKLARVKKALFDKVQVGINALEVEELASRLIKEEGAEAAFKRVPGYSWATCINVNSGLVHGIPKKELVFKKDDLVSVDLGLYFKGFNTDCSFSKLLGGTAETKKFFETGKTALKEAISKAKVGNRVYDISEAMEKVIKGAGYSPVRALVGHGVGRELHEDPQIPCFKPGRREESMIIPDGATLAIEVMYTLGSPELVQENDGWTISTRDGKISALFEETVAVTKNGTLVLTT